METTYLDDTKEFGNVFTGWDAYLSAEKSKIKKNIANEDRYFSLSSITSPASRKLKVAKAENAAETSSKGPHKKKQKTAADGGEASK